uniref:UDP-N-acetylglucosamine 2-epimerase domain-containing protein n=1 Tax=Palpitomonas bilix TaxID=652834 RepID=A0A7S3D8H9_9EUKA|mmetsp:Transcript_26649/g.68437  ORF Transcript_26649/g.68437 Transcript_26649/m.68437 type:complete len:425 (+) Transcript_26649:177-1451(+)
MSKVFKIHLIVGARPNLVKAAPLLRALRSKPEWFDCTLVDTGQHYDRALAGIFREQFEMGEPDVSLCVGSGTHGKQTAAVLERYEAYILEKAEHRPDAVVVLGDVNSTVACALAASKLHIKVVHLESGLRSRDRSMPEEINRILTDQLADLLWTPSEDADANLLGEGIAKEKVECVGNIMIDSLVAMLPAVSSRQAWKEYGVNEGDFAVTTLHRPANVDDEVELKKLCDILLDISQLKTLVWPIHPRTRARLKASPSLYSLLTSSPRIIMTDPLGYVEFLSLVSKASFVVTDSGGIQEETSWLGIPCLTLRPNTERPITISKGTNTLVPIMSEVVGHAARIVAEQREHADGGQQRGRESENRQSSADAGEKRRKIGDKGDSMEESVGSVAKRPSIHPLWDGHTATRCVNSLYLFLNGALGEKEC